MAKLNKNWGLLLFLFLCLLLCLPLLNTSQIRAEKIPSVYIVKKGDTLWSISNRYFKDPFLWPTLWKNNKYIQDPQWIYPGQPLLLKEKKLVPAKIKHPIQVVKATRPKPVIPPAPPQPPEYITDRDQIDSCGYILPEKESQFREKYEKWGMIIDGKEKKISYSYPDLIYINKGQKEVSSGDIFTVLRSADTIFHPTTNEKLGYLIHILGIVKVQEVFDKIALVKIIKSFSEMHLQDRITAYQKIPLPVRREPKKNIQGMLIANEDGRFNLAENNIVFLDQGKKQQVRAGNYFSIYKQDSILGENKKKKDIPPVTINDIIGELVVLKTEEDTSTALITKSKDIILVGYQFSANP